LHNREEIDFSYSHEEKARFRGNAYYERGRIGIELRFIPQEIQTLEELNLPQDLAEFTRKQQGFSWSSVRSGKESQRRSPQCLR
jgi:Tfp pilus assembly pilus retraction ATPase PilT